MFWTLIHFWLILSESFYVLSGRNQRFSCQQLIKIMLLQMINSTAIHHQTAKVTL